MAYLYSACVTQSLKKELFLVNFRSSIQYVLSCCALVRLVLSSWPSECHGDSECSTAQYDDIDRNVDILSRKCKFAGDNHWHAQHIVSEQFSCTMNVTAHRKACLSCFLSLGFPRPYHSRIRDNARLRRRCWSLQSL